MNHAAERESVFRREKVERFVLEHHLGEQSFDELQSAISQTDLVPAKHLYTTEAAIRRELDTIAMMRQGQGQVEAIAPLSEASAFVADTVAETGGALTEGQHLAILETAISQDQFIAWQGVAGAGKTYSLKLLAQFATEQGYAVTGYAPSSQAANVLAEEANIEGNTVARLLHSQDRSDSDKRTIWVVDEAGLLSAKDAHALLKKAQANDARVILVGDTRQLSAVEAGNPFRSLQSAGLKTTFLEESRRQKTKALQTAVVCLAAGEQTEGLATLDSAGMVSAVEDSTIRQLTMTRDYIRLSPAAREETLILSGTNAERLELTSSIRKALQGEGTLGEDTFTMESLRALDRTEAQLKYACAYRLNDVVVAVQDAPRYGIKRREQYRVVGQAIAANQLTLEAPDGSTFAFDPATCSRKTTYEVQQLAIAPGDKLRWTRNDAIEGVRNGQMVTVESIDALGKATVRDPKGELMSISLSGQQYLDYALVSTTYSSQGKTAERVLAAIDSTLSKEGLYVAVSRAKSNLSLYTTDRKALYKKAQRSSAKQNPSDYLTLFEIVNPDVQQQQKNAQPTGPLRGADQSEHAGDCAGKRIAGSYEADVRRDDHLERGSQGTQRTAASLTRSISRQADRARHRAMVNRAPYQQQYQQYAAGYPAGGSAIECDRFVTRQMVSELLKRSNGRSLTTNELKQVALVVGQGPIAQQLKRAEGQDASVRYVAGLTVDEKWAMEKAPQTEPTRLTQEQRQISQRKKQVQQPQNQTQKRQRSKGSGLDR